MISPPLVYYDSTFQQIIIDGTGISDYYDVTIESAAISSVVISTQVDGSYDTIDISSLTADDYIITITSTNNNVFEGQFCIEE